MKYKPANLKNKEEAMHRMIDEAELNKKINEAVNQLKDS